MFLDYDGDLGTAAPATVAEVAATFPDPGQRRTTVELMLIAELCLHEIPAELSASIDRWAADLGASDIDLAVARELAHAARARAYYDLYRNGFRAPAPRWIRHSSH